MSTINVNEKLLKEAMILSGKSNPEEVINCALEQFTAKIKRNNVKLLFGKVKWDGSLKRIRG